MYHYSFDSLTLQTVFPFLNIALNHSLKISIERQHLIGWTLYTYTANNCQIIVHIICLPSGIYPVGFFYPVGKKEEGMSRFCGNLDLIPKSTTDLL